MADDVDHGDGFAGLDVLADALSAAGPLAPLGFLLGLTPPVRRQRARSLFEDLLDLIEADPGWVAEQIASRPKVAKLWNETGRLALTGEDFDEKRRAYVRILESGFGPEDQVDEARMMAEAIGSLKAPAVTALAMTPVDLDPNQEPVAQAYPEMSARLSAAAMAQLVALGLATSDVPTYGVGRPLYAPQLTAWGQVICEALDVPAPGPPGR